MDQNVIIPGLQLATTIFTAIVAFFTAIVALLAYLISRRNSLGLAPVLLFTYVTRWPKGQYYDTEGDALVVECEFWNRRTYPIAVHNVGVDVECVFEDIRALRSNVLEAGPLNHFMGPDKPVVLKPSGHYSIECVFDKVKLDGVDRPPVLVTVSWADPFSQKVQRRRWRHYESFDQMKKRIDKEERRLAKT